MMRFARKLIPVLFVIISGAASAQSLLPFSGSIFPTQRDLNRRHMSPYGKPCLAFKAFVKAEGATNSFFVPREGQGVGKETGAAVKAPKIYEHGIKASNTCGQNIKVQICYYKSDDCIKLNVPPWGEKEGVLGIYPGEDAFRYEAEEQFP